jgi:hypothetical protein
MEHTQERSAEIIWPDLSLDQAAWALAKAALPNGTIREQAARAVDILRELKLKGGK